MLFLVLLLFQRREDFSNPTNWKFVTNLVGAALDIQFAAATKMCK